MDDFEVTLIDEADVFNCWVTGWYYKHLDWKLHSRS